MSFVYISKPKLSLIVSFVSRTTLLLSPKVWVSDLSLLIIDYLFYSNISFDSKTVKGDIDDIEISQNGLSITNKEYISSGNPCHLKQCIKTYGKHHWKIKLNKYRRNFVLCIGVGITKTNTF